MSGTKKTTENKTETEKVDTAPYLKKDKQQDNRTESSKSNLVMPLVLLLVSAIVIIATFYEDEYKDLVAQAEPATDSLESAASADVTATDTVAAAVTTDEKIIAKEPVAKEDTASAAEINTMPTTPIAKQLPAAAITMAALVEVTETESAENNAAAGPAQSRYAPYQRQPYANRQAYEQARRKAMADTQAQAKKHDEMMQQRRQAYEKEMQARREQREAMMKTYQEKRAKIAETQKAIYQQFEQNRSEAMQKMEQMHKEISDLHKQMHQMMRDSQPQFRHNSAAPKQDTKAEQMQSI